MFFGGIVHLFFLDTYFSNNINIIMFESFQGNNPMDLSDSLDDKNILILHKNIFLTNIIKMNHKTI